MFKKFLCAAILAVAANVAFADQQSEPTSKDEMQTLPVIVSVNKGIVYLTGKNEDERKVFLGYLYGALGMGNNAFFCLPAVPTLTQVGFTAVYAFNAIPEDKRDTTEAADAVAMYLAARFKCVKT